MEGAVHQQVAAAGAPQLVGDIHRGVTHDEDESVVAQVNLEMGKCYVFSAVGDSATVEELKIYLFNPNSQRVLDQDANAPKVMASFCVTGQMVINIVPFGWGSSVAMAVPGLYKVELKTTEGYGHVQFGVFVTGQQAPSGAQPTPQPSAPASGAGG